MSATICVPGWTSRVRPPSSYTTALKERQLAAGYAWHGDTRTGDYEEDHLIPLELGGSPSAPANLWPEPYATAEGAVSKDEVENRLHDLVCSGALGLRAAQMAIAANWWIAGEKYASRPAPTTPPAAPRPPASRSSSAAPAPQPHGCTTTSTGKCIRAGEFCPKDSYGETGYDANGRALECTGGGSRPRWT